MSNESKNSNYVDKLTHMEDINKPAIDVPPCSVLRSDQIEKLVHDHNLLIVENYSERQVRAASYDVRLGPEFYQDGKIINLSRDGDKEWIKIKPLDIVYVSSLESFHLPSNIVGRYSLRLGKMYEGLVLAGGGAQIDPGYHGKLFGLLINFSNQDILLQLEEHWATIEFSPTTYEPGISKLYENQIPNYQGCMSLQDLFPKPIEIEARKRQPVTSAMALLQSEFKLARGEFDALANQKIGEIRSWVSEQTSEYRNEIKERYDRLEREYENKYKYLERRMNVYTFSLFAVFTITIIVLVLVVLLK